MKVSISFSFPITPTHFDNLCLRILLIETRTTLMRSLYLINRSRAVNKFERFDDIKATVIVLLAGKEVLTLANRNSAPDSERF